METWQRFIDYVKIHTASSEDTEATPTTQRQFDLSRHLEQELKDIGMENVGVDEYAYVYGFLPATPGCEECPTVALIAHLDTIPDFSGENVRPQLVENYDGGVVVLRESGRVLDPEVFPHLKGLLGHTLITTDGTTVLGADDKAGIAEIVTACERIISQKLPHGGIAVCFTPDEEVGHGAALLDLERLGADFAYTVDGGELNDINFETFNAAAAHWDIAGVNIHPGSAKNHMVNASLVAMEINAMLPAGDIPAKTEGYEGFFHLCEMSGGVDKASMDYIVRDHDEASFEARKQTLRHIEKVLNEKYGAGTVKLTLRESYRNMAEKVKERPEIVEMARRAVRAAGYEPTTSPIRGGTDGSQLSYRGLLCPNLGTGGYACHGPYEHTTVQNLEGMTRILLNLVAEIIR